MRAAVGDEQERRRSHGKRAVATGWRTVDRQASSPIPASGTMCNQISILVHCQPGDWRSWHTKSAHIIAGEGGGPGALAGTVVLDLQGDARGDVRQCHDWEAAAAGKAGEMLHRRPWSRFEQTANAGGRSVWPLPLLTDVLTTAHEHDMRTHMDWCAVDERRDG